MTPALADENMDEARLAQAYRNDGRKTVKAEPLFETFGFDGIHLAKAWSIRITVRQETEEAHMQGE